MTSPYLRPYSKRTLRWRAGAFLTGVAGTVQSLLRTWLDVGDSRDVKFGIGIPIVALLAVCVAGFFISRRGDHR